MKWFERHRAVCAALSLVLGGLAVVLMCWALDASAGASTPAPPGPVVTTGARPALPAGGEVLWQEDGVPACTAILLQDWPDIVGDGEGGAILVWEDYRYGANSRLFAQRVYSDGTAAWPADGVSLSLAPGSQARPQIVSDETGGAIVVWESGDIYAQRVYSDGTAAWTTDGVSLCVASGSQWETAIAGDGRGGAIVAWGDERDGNGDIYAQRVYSNGAVVWSTDGVSLSAASGDQVWPDITDDGNEGAIVTWYDSRHSYWDIYAQRVYSDGTAAWTTDGVSLCVASGYQMWPRITEDEASGAIVTWEDSRNGSVDIYAQRVYSDGTVAWATDGVSLCVAAGDQRYPAVVGDGAGGAIVAWQDERRGEWDIYAQRVYSNGTVAWATNGIAIAVSSSHQWYPEVVSDGAGGAIIAWQGWQGHIYPRVYAQRVRADGTTVWKPNGISLSSTWESQERPRIAPDGQGGAVVAWRDSRDLFGVTGINVYAQRVGEVVYRWYLPYVVRDDGARYERYLPFTLKED